MGFVMSAALRVSHILKEVSNAGQVSATELAEELNVSVETIRRDLKKLDEREELVRVHGGAICKAYKDEGASFNKRASNNIQEKKIIVGKALAHVYEGAIIGLDASSSSWHVAQAIPDIKCTIVTNSLNNVVALAGKKIYLSSISVVSTQINTKPFMG
ncbi:L-fucose operon activator [Vibrio variabilis]|uniref:L-fucose operon activator n=1 Tax=Vibrio variabilis TaxID=990271 RepID=A0ABQ0JHH0_9VIBR|nr:L-fucose operon activator [Vibrio variabilis]